MDIHPGWPKVKWRMCNVGELWWEGCGLRDRDLWRVILGHGV